MFKRKANNEINFVNNDVEFDDISIDTYYNDTDIDEVLDEISKPKVAKKKRKQEEFYVKGADLITEIKKYQVSKQQDADMRRCTVFRTVWD